MSSATSAATRTLEDNSTAQDLTRQISSVSERPLKHRGLADVWSAEWHPADGKTIKVALKALRLSNNAKENIPTENSTKEKFLRALRKEIAVWQKLEHENIQPFLGLYYDSDELPNMVSPWQNHGDINRYIRVAKVQSVAVKLELLSQVAQGLKYLHDHNIVHGDIKGANVLISEQGTALLADFGFSVILAEVSETSTPESSSDAFANGTYRFMAPEYCSDKPTRRRKEGDIWAYGCLFLEVMSGRLPYYDKPTVPGVIVALSQRKLPCRPDNFPDLFWMFFLICCTMESYDRLSVDIVLAQLAVLMLMEDVAATGQTSFDCLPSTVQPGQDAFDNDPSDGNDHLSPTLGNRPSGLSLSSPEPSIHPPPSPTLTIRSVHFPTSLALRNSDPSATDGKSSLGLLNTSSPTHGRKSSVATLNSADGSQDGTEPDPRGVQTPLPSSRHLYPPPSPTVHSVTTTAVRDDDAQSRVSKGQQAKEDKSNEAAAKLHVNASEDIAEAAPFPFKPLQLAALLDPKSVSKLGELGGASAVFDGLGTDPHRGLSAHSLEPSLEGGKDPLKASIADRKRIYGTNVLPTRPSKSLLQLMWLAFKDKILIILSIAALVSLVLGLYEDLGQAPRQFSCDTNPSRKCNEPHVDWVEGLAILIAILIVVLVGSLNDWQKERQFRVLNEKKEDRGVKIIRDGKEQVVNIKDVLVGDLAVLEPGEIVPCDGILVQGHNIQCDESSATGETHAIRKIPYEACKDSESDKEDCFLISGSKVLEGTGTYVLIAIGSKSSYGRIMMALRSDTENTPLQAKLNALAELIAKLGSAAGGFLFAVLMIKFFVQLGTNRDRIPSEKASNFIDILIIAITLIVVAIPAGLPLAVTLALAFATKRMKAQNLLVRVLSSCEIMANASVICTDKTGTLTQNLMTVVAGSIGIHGKFVRHLENNKIRIVGGERDKQGPNQDLEKGKGEKRNAPCIAATELPPTERKHKDDFSLDHSELKMYISPALRLLFNEAICVNSTAFEDKNKDTNEIEFVGSMTEGALLRFAQTLEWEDYRTVREAADVVHMFPFSSERKAMGVVVRLSDSRYRFYVKGASEILTKLCSTHVVVAKPGETPSQDDHIETKDIDELARDNIKRTIIVYANQSLRTIALCYRDLTAWPPHGVNPEAGEDPYPELAKDLTLIAITGIEDPVRPGVREAVEECAKAGVSVKMCTGDNVLTARSIAAQCGIFTPGGLIMEGPVFRDLTEHEMKEIIPRLQVLARSSPRDKQILVENLKAMGEIVTVTGDGANDGPALKTANVGFSMGIAGTEVAKEASDIILLDDNFVSIVSAIMWGRCVNDAVRKFLQFQLSVNITAVIITFVTAVASGSESSVLSAVQLLWVNIIMDTFAALALATDLATRDLLNRRPDRKAAPLFTIDMSKQIIGQSIYSTAVVFILHFAGNLIFGYGHKGESENRHDEEVLKTRLDRDLNVCKGILLNWHFIAITLIEVCVQVLIVFVGGPAFHVTEITGRDWAISIIVGFGAMVVGAIMRLVPDGIFEVAFVKLRLIRDPNELPTFNRNPAPDDVRERLTIFRSVRGGRLRGTLF
ncbi:calcium-translocating P-type ATPase [Exidia glandulosa HHB12029]|uniref:Calcium-transporting ATPase n=1 Tax=Exidia glandulosa HHB12029 TaxID=1314781 RepID=A0A165NUL8_EXIGL|nr:calcium-translocating P-type ATPase [Exidia glandulosa HHB12029]